MVRGSVALLILSSVLLSACGSQREIAARNADAERLTQSQRENRCTSFGYQPGLPEFSKCLERMYVADQQQKAAEQAAEADRMQRVGDALQGLGAGLSAAGAPPPPMQRPVQCTTVGRTTTCN
jgi:hypothetical protein